MNKEKELKKGKVSFAQFYSQFGVFLILIVAVLISAFLTDTFLTGRNILNILRQNTVVTLIAFGAQIVLICGDVDLSPGSVAALAGCGGAAVFVATNSLMIAILAALGIGVAVGLLNGFVITKCDIPAFIMTLATQEGVRALIYIFTDAKPISNLGDGFSWLGQGNLFSIPVPIWVLFIAFALIWVLMNRTSLGRHFYAVGGNKIAAKASGINVSAVRIKAFVMQGALAGLGGIILMSRLNSGQPSSAVSYEFDAITAAIVGGTSMSGGIGNVYGTIAGALFVGVLVNIMTLTNVNSYVQQLVRGCVIALAVIIDVQVRKRQGSTQ